MKRWPLVLALLLSVGVNLGIFGSLWSQRVKARSHPGAATLKAPQLERVADRLELVGGERRRFLEAQYRFLATFRQEGQRLAEDRRELRRQLTDPRPDRARVEELVRLTGRRAEAMDRAFVENVLFVREVLEGAREERYVRMLGQLYGRERGLPPSRRRR